MTRDFPDGPARGNHLADWHSPVIRCWPGTLLTADQRPTGNVPAWREQQRETHRHGGDARRGGRAPPRRETRCSPSPAGTSSRSTTGRSTRTRRCGCSTSGTSRRAVFAAEATARLTRAPGLAVLTAGPGVTNGVSGVATAHFNGSPVVVIGGRAPDSTAGARAACRRSTTRRCSPRSPSAPATGTRRRPIGAARRRGVPLATAPHRGPVFLDVPHGPPVLRPAPTRSTDTGRRAAVAAGARPRRGRRDRPPARRGRAAGAGARLRRVAGRRRGGRAGGSPRNCASRSSPTARAAASCPPATRCWSPGPAATAFGQADLVVVVGTPLDFRLGYGVFGGKDGAAAAPRSCTWPTRPASSPRTCDPPALGRRRPGRGLHGLGARLRRRGRPAKASRRGWTSWPPGRRRGQPRRADAALLASDADPIHPCAIYGELARLARRRRRGDRRRRRLRLLRGQVRRAEAARRTGSTRARTAAWAPAWATRSPPGWPGRPPRWCCCSATARRASR